MPPRVHPEEAKIVLDDGFTYGKLSFSDLVAMGTDNAAFQGWKKAAEANVQVGLDNFHVVYEGFASGSFYASIKGECTLLYTESSTIGDMVSLLRAGRLSGLVVVFWTLFVCLVTSSIVLNWFVDRFEDKNAQDVIEEAEEEKIVQRDFTVQQLREYDGIKNKEGKIFISLKSIVYDVSSAHEFYSEGKAYHCMAGREASRALALLSFDEKDLSSTTLSDLGPFEKETLDGWEEKFKYFKSYPVVGRCVFNDMPPQLSDTAQEFPYTREQLSSPKLGLKVINIDELSQFKGYQAVPSGRTNAPIYIGLNGYVIDVSFGGMEMYAKEFMGNKGPYHLFAGIDASKALAKMSFKDEDTGSRDLSDLTEEQRKVLYDWEKRFVAVKKYPIVALLEQE